MKVWILMALGLSLMGTGCNGDDGGGDGGGGAGDGGASGMNGGGMGGAGGVGGGGGDIPIAPAQPDGQVVAPWDQYCVATFTEAFDVIDSFGDEVELAIQVGDRYLLGAEGFFGEATIVYISDDGPVDFELEILDETMPPFTSSCTGATESRIGVFVDTVVYSDEALTMPVCTLQAGLTVPGSGVNLSLSGEGYDVDLMGLAAECGGVSDGFVKAVHVETDYGGYFGVPFATLLAPAM